MNVRLPMRELQSRLVQVVEEAMEPHWDRYEVDGAPRTVVRAIVNTVIGRLAICEAKLRSDDDSDPFMG